MPEKRDKPDPVGRQISTTVKIIHGQHPVEREGRWRWLWNFIHQGSDIQEYLVVVPPNFKVLPPLIDGGEFEIAYNYSMTKAVAAIAQILYGNFQLFQSAKPQIDYYGYNAYQLTIIPYIIMSFLNLIASLCEPQFPALYLVDSELVAVAPSNGGAAGPVDCNSLEHGVVDTPKTSGVVGTIAKDSDTKARSIFSIRRKDVYYPPRTSKIPANLNKSAIKAWGALIGCSMLVVCATIIPVIILAFITNIDSVALYDHQKEKAGPEDFFDGWVLYWLVFGQIYSLLVFLPGLNSNPRPAFRLFRTLLFLVVSIFAVCYAIFMVQLIIIFMIHNKSCLKI